MDCHREILDMTQHYAALALAALLGLFMAACASVPAPAPAEPPKPTLSEEAKSALTRAEADAKAARVAHTLWLPAEDALKKASEAALVFDSASVIKQAQIVSELCQISARQPGYPSTEPK
jgi:hypothetical protein